MPCSSNASDLAPDYVADVRRALAGRMRVFGVVPYDDDEAASVEYVATLAAKEPA